MEFLKNKKLNYYYVLLVIQCQARCEGLWYSWPKISIIRVIRQELPRSTDPSACHCTTCYNVQYAKIICFIRKKSKDLIASLPPFLIFVEILCRQKKCWVQFASYLKEYFISVKPICSPDLRLPPLEWPGISNAGMQEVGAGESCHRQLHLRHPWLLDHRNFIYTIIGWEGAL